QGYDACQAVTDDPRRVSDIRLSPLSTRFGMPIISPLIRCHLWLTKGMYALAIISLLLFTVMFNIAVALRYFFNAPTSWSQDVIGIATLVVIFLGLPYVTMKNSHVTIDILVTQLKPGAAKFLNLIARITTVAVLAYAAYLVGGEAMKQFTR